MRLTPSLGSSPGRRPSGHESVAGWLEMVKIWTVLSMLGVDLRTRRPIYLRRGCGRGYDCACSEGHDLELSIRLRICMHKEAPTMTSDISCSSRGAMHMGVSMQTTGGRLHVQQQAPLQGYRVSMLSICALPSSPRHFVYPGKDFGSHAATPYPALAAIPTVHWPVHAFCFPYGSA